MPLIGIRAQRRRRIVGLLKLALPLSALALLSMVFLLAAPIDPTRAILSAPIDVTERARDPRLSGARFAGVNDDGAAIWLEAGEARGDAAGALRFEVQDLSLQMTTAEGGRLFASARSGRLDRAAGNFHMNGEVLLTAAPGYQIAATALTGQLDNTGISVSGPVTGSAPAGQIEAGSLEIASRSTGDGSYRLVFQGGVRLIYQPEE